MKTRYGVLQCFGFFLLALAECSQALWAGEAPTVILVAEPDPGRAARHGLAALTLALEEKGMGLIRATNMNAAVADYVVVAGLAFTSRAVADLVQAWDLEAYQEPESILIHKEEREGRTILLVAGADDRGLMYGLLDVADRVGWAKDATNPFEAVRDVLEKPAVSERAVSIYTMHRRTFEKRLFNERYWARYLDQLARNRFNSFVLIFGYENGGYFAPAYPYFFNVEGFPGVRVVGFTEAEQERYLQALNRLIDMAHDRGVDFTVGLWDHIYRGGVQTGGVAGADPNRGVPGIVRGLTETNLMEYSTAALAKFLEEVPGLDGVQFRMHNESGLKRGAEMRRFWKDIYQVIKNTRPDLRFDARAKEFPDELIDLALEMGIHLRITTKYWAEQMGMPFHPTHINRQNQFDRRHGYADLLRYPQRYQMHWRLWNGGTTRVLLWGNPEYARRFAQSTHLYHGDGFEVNEMLATKMEAQPHDQEPFELLRPAYRYYDWEFERYWHFFQVFGRIGYNPDTPPEVWQREFQRRFGPEAAPWVETGLHRASWILPRINASLFPYHRFPTTRGWAEKQRWEDLPAYAQIEGSDTQQFLSFAEAARHRLDGTVSAKLSPEQNSAWFARVSREVLASVDQAEASIGRRRNKEFESTMVDLRILANLALYHSRRIQAGLQYALFKASGDVNALEETIGHEGNAMAAWEEMVAAAGDVYAEDLMMGLRQAGLAGHWRDELQRLQRGLAELEAQRDQFQPEATAACTVAHAPVVRARPGQALNVRATIAGPEPVVSVRLHWRVGEGDFQIQSMAPDGPFRFCGAIRAPAFSGIGAYYMEAVDAQGQRTLFPSGGKEHPIRFRVTEDQNPPELTHAAVRRARPGQALKIAATARDVSGVRWVRLRYRGVTQHEDYRTLEMTSNGQSGLYEATVPGEDIRSEWDFMYFFEVMDEVGNGRIYPDLDQETPYVVVPLER